MDPQSGTIKRRGCVYSGICLFSFLCEAEPHRCEILSYFRRRSRRIYALSVVDGGRATEEDGEEESLIPELTKAERIGKKGERKGGRVGQGGRVEGKSRRITMQLFSFQLVNGF